MWTIMTAVLLLGNDVRVIDNTTLAVLRNRVAIAVNQDPLGQMGLRLDNSSSASTQAWLAHARRSPRTPTPKHTHAR